MAIFGKKKKVAPFIGKGAFEVIDASAPGRVGLYYARRAITITRYRVPFELEANHEVEVVLDSDIKLLVNIDKGTTIYIDSDFFSENFKRK